MPKRGARKNRRQGRGGRNRQGDRVETVVSRMNFETLISVSGSARTGVSYIQLNPNFIFGVTTGGNSQLSGDNKLIAYQTLFTYFRVTKLRMRLIPSVLAVTAVEAAGSWNVVAGYLPNASQIIPSTYSGALQLPFVTETVCFNADGGTLPSVPKWITVPKRMLLGTPLKWWKCLGGLTSAPGTSNFEFYFQGVLVAGVISAPVTATSYVTWGLDLEMTVQFKDFYPQAGPTLDMGRAISGHGRLPARLAAAPPYLLDAEDDEKKQPDPAPSRASEFEEEWLRAKDTEFTGLDSTLGGLPL